jgi:hypothetical protein
MKKKIKTWVIKIKKRYRFVSLYLVAGARTFLKEGQARTDALPKREGYEP